MFWADKIASDIIQSGKYKPYWVDDMKTPSGRIHVGGLRAVTTHDIVYKALLDTGAKAKFTYVFDNHDPMDSLPAYLPKDEYEKYLGFPLFMVPSPKAGFKNYAEYFAKEFQDGFRRIDCDPEIIWTTDLYFSGKINQGIKKCLDNADKIRKIYEDLYKKKMVKDWYPFNVYCPKCNKVSTTKTIDWDGKQVTFECRVDAVVFTKGCGHKGKISPFATKDKINGKLPWKVEWAVKWQAIGITIEGAGKDHMTKGGSHDLAKRVAEEILDYKTPYAFAHEFFLVGGRKMSTSKGAGISVAELLEILPPELVRFLIVKTKLNQAINFDPGGNTIPDLFDDYQKAATSPDSDLKRIFELSQVGKKSIVPKVRFSTLSQWVQMPNMEEEIKKANAQEWAKYARVWVEKFAPEEEKFTVQDKLPKEIQKLSNEQKELLLKISKELEKKWTGEDFQTRIYEIGKELGLNGAKTFEAIYISLIGKDHGPKAAWLILSLDKKFVKTRFEEAQYSNNTYYHSETKESNSSVHRVQILNKPEIFSIDKNLAEKVPSISIGIAIIKNVSIKKTDENLGKEKQKLLSSFSGLTTEKLGQYPEIISYRKLFKETGIDWHSRRPSPEALLRRVALKKGLYTINTAVDSYNLVVMRHRVSVGAFDYDEISFPTLLRFAKEREEIHLLGDEQPTKYKEGEIAYFDKTGGFNIDFNYRDAQRTAVQLSTKNLYINVDGVYDITPKKVEQVLKETCDTIIKYCGGSVELFGIETAS